MKWRLYSSMLTRFLITAALVMALTKPVAAAPLPGSDAFGYIGSNISHVLRDISSSGTFVSLADGEVSSPRPIGFTFNFYGNNFRTFQISSNGFINLGEGHDQSGCCYGHVMPSVLNPNNTIAGWWEDLNSPEGNIRYQTLGLAPNRQLVVGFYNVPHYYFGVAVTFEIVLHEGSNNIEIQCGQCFSEGGLHTIGIENASGTAGLEVFEGEVPRLSEVGSCR